MALRIRCLSQRQSLGHAQRSAPGQPLGFHATCQMTRIVQQHEMCRDRSVERWLSPQIKIFGWDYFRHLSASLVTQPYHSASFAKQQRQSKTRMNSNIAVPAFHIVISSLKSSGAPSDGTDTVLSSSWSFKYGYVLGSAAAPPGFNSIPPLLVVDRFIFPPWLFRYSFAPR